MWKKFFSLFNLGVPLSKCTALWPNLRNFPLKSAVFLPYPGNFWGTHAPYAFPITAPLLLTPLINFHCSSSSWSSRNPIKTFQRIVVVHSIISFLFWQHWHLKFVKAQMITISLEILTVITFWLPFFWHFLLLSYREVSGPLEETKNITFIKADYLIRKEKK